MKKIVVYLILFSATLVSAQTGFLQGYILTNKGDTLKGKIKDRKYSSSLVSWQKIEFIDSTRKGYSYDPEEIKEYRQIGKPRYVTLVIGVEAKKTFLEVSEEGPVLLYSYYRGSWGAAGNAVSIQKRSKESKDRTAFYALLQGAPIQVTDDKQKVECFLQQRGKPASLMQWRPRDYKQTAKVFFGDNPEIMKLVQTDVLDEDDIFAIVRRYNQAKSGK